MGNPNTEQYRFENTRDNLNDCYEHMDNNNLSDSEESAKNDIINLCFQITDYYKNEHKTCKKKEINNFTKIF